ncbi:MAG: stage II sporulation protein R [Lachnospiraceae bacterium]
MKKYNLLRTALLAVLLLLAAEVRFGEDVAAKQEEISAKVIRFHVRANSDSPEDQELKMAVKEAVVGYMEEILKGAQSAEQSAEIINKHMEEILLVASERMHELGYSYDLRGYLVKEYFPLRVYADVALPPGEYTAFRIDIGEARGKNWWCMLYPALCFVDITHGVVPDESKEELKSVIGEEDYTVVDTYSLEFKYLKFLNKYVE